MPAPINERQSCVVVVVGVLFFSPTTTRGPKGGHACRCSDRTAAEKTVPFSSEERWLNNAGIAKEADREEEERGPRTKQDRSVYSAAPDAFFLGGTPT